MASRKIRVLVVDDSAVIREMISDFIAETSDMEVAGKALDGRQALKVFQDVNPDVVTLDIEMPKMNGLETLEALLAMRPVPVIMVSSLTQLGADKTFQALDGGALDYVAKPDVGRGAAEALGGELLRKIRAVAGSDVQHILQIRRERAKKAKARAKQRRVAPVEKPVDSSIQLADKIIALGISTGGPPALTTLFEGLQSPVPPIVIVQHMPQSFTKPFAWRLNSISSLNIKEAETGDILKPNHVYVAPGGKHLHLMPCGRQAKCRVRDGDLVSGHKPSVDVMMRCAAEIYGDRVLGVIMTGMGRDGADGCGAIRAAGGFVLGQDEDSSDVYGMNKVAMVEGNIDRQFSLDEAAGTIMVQVKRLWGRASVGA